MDFKDLDSAIQLDQIERLSHKSTQLIFKHSTRCIISSMALKRLRSCTDLPADCWVLDLLSFRSISNEIALRYHTEHQSPQLFVIRNGQVIGSTSHEGIDCDFILTCNEK
ncbi:MAG: bacillithiol system redox-active protein YtxJ [Flavobacteriales bacterium]|jgi:bacillithiol system protein YtxJ